MIISPGLNLFICTGQNYGDVFFSRFAGAFLTSCRISECPNRQTGNHFSSAISHHHHLPSLLSPSFRHASSLRGLDSTGVCAHPHLIAPLGRRRTLEPSPPLTVPGSKDEHEMDRIHSFLPIDSLRTLLSSPLLSVADLDTNAITCHG